MFRRTAPFLILVVASMGAADVSAATYVVNTFDVDAVDTNTALAGCDSNALVAGDQCTLRAAIMQANAGPGADTIVLPLDAVISLSASGGGDLGDLDISAPVTITGIADGMPDDVTRLPRIVGAHADRLFEIQSTAVVLRGLRLEQGERAGSDGGAVRVAAGATVEVDRVRFADNSAQNGGAISNFGQLDVTGSDFVRNRSVAGGAAILNEGVLAIRSSSLRQMRDLPSIDTIGMIRSEAGASLTIENSTINGAPDPFDPTSTGGLVVYQPAQLTIRNSTFNDFTSIGLRLYPAQDSQILVANSIFASGEFVDCEITAPPDYIGTDLRIGFSLVGQGNCGDFAADGSAVSDAAPILGPLQQVPGSVTLHHTPSFISRGVDEGQTDAGGPLGPDFACLTTDARGTLRPLDGNGIGIAACDMGAIEASQIVPSTFVVNVFEQDLPDPDLVDGRCDVDAGQDGDQCTLRAAVMQANFRYGPDRIEFVSIPDANEITLSIAPGIEPNAAAGDLDITEQVVIDGIASDGRAVTTVRQTAGDRIFDIATPAGQTVLFQELRLTGGDASAGGGAIRVRGDGSRFTLERSEVFGNEATVGGAIDSTRRVDVLDSDLHLNVASQNGGAIRIDADQLRLFDSSVWNNTASAAIDAESSAIHGISPNLLFVRNSTISGNSGGIFLRDGTALITASTVVDNVRHALRVQRDTTASVELWSSVYAGSGGMDCQLIGGVNVATNAFNLVEDGSCASPQNLSGDPVLAPALARLDGQVSRVHIPLAGSPVLEAVPDAEPACPNLDQRSRSRPLDATPDDGVPPACDIGALEMQASEVGPKRMTVNLIDDDRVDINPGDSLCDSSAASGLQCSLRAAIMESNALPGAETIFVPGTDLSSPGVARGGLPQELVIDLPPLAGPASAAHGDLDIFGPLVIDGIAIGPATANQRRHVVASHGDRIFSILAPGEEVTIRGLRLSGGDAASAGGAVRVLAADRVTLERLEISGNVAVTGGGAVAVQGGTVEIIESDLHGNGTTGEGAAVYNQAELLLDRSSVRGNLDLSPQREAIASGAGSVTIAYNSTITGNSGDGLRIQGGTLVVENSSIVANEQRGIGVTTAAGQGLFISNSAFFGNGIASCAVGGAFGIVIATDDHNFAPGVGCGLENGASNLDGSLDPQLGELQVSANRYSAYFVPGFQSPLVDAASPEFNLAGCQDLDQAGETRPADGNGDGVVRCDVGAIERRFSPQDVSIFSDGFEEGGLVGPVQTRNGAAR
jgi:hypothetical protein